MMNMRKRLRSLAAITISAIGFLFLAINLSAQSQNLRPTSSQQDALKSFVQAYTRMPISDHGRDTPYVSAFADLKDAGELEAIVYLTDNLVWEWRLHNVDTGSQRFNLRTSHKNNSHPTSNTCLGHQIQRLARHCCPGTWWGNSTEL